MKIRKLQNYGLFRRSAAADDEEAPQCLVCDKQSIEDANTRKAALESIRREIPEIQKHFACCVLFPENPAGDHWKHEMKTFLIGINSAVTSLKTKSGRLPEETLREKIHAEDQTIGKRFLAAVQKEMPSGSISHAVETCLEIGYSGFIDGLIPLLLKKDSGQEIESYLKHYSFKGVLS